MLPDAEFLWLVHEDDCHPESLLPENMSPVAVIGALATSTRSPLNVNDSVKGLAREAVRDAINRTLGRPAAIEGDWAAPLIKACEDSGVKNIITAYTPIGPSAQALTKAEPELSRAGITVCQIIRPWDSLTWPFANRGFFKVKKKMSRILQDLQHHDVQGKLL